MVNTFCVNIVDEEKTLYEECEGNFLTDPSSVRLYLTDIVEHFSDCLPFKAMVFLNSDVTDESVSHLASEIVSLTHVSVVTSIIATTCLNEDAPDQQISELDYENDTPIAIPIELEISVHVLRDQSEEERLYQCTRELFDNFDPTKIRNISGPSHCTHSGSLRQSVRAGYELRGLEILKPTRIYDVGDYAQGDDGEIRDSEFTSQGNYIIAHKVQLICVHVGGSKFALSTCQVLLQCSYQHGLILCGEIWRGRGSEDDSIPSYRCRL